jgi:hypothetical protein
MGIDARGAAAVKARKRQLEEAFAQESPRPCARARPAKHRRRSPAHEEQLAPPASATRGLQAQSVEHAQGCGPAQAPAAAGLGRGGCGRRARKAGSMQGVAPPGGRDRRLRQAPARNKMLQDFI